MRRALETVRLRRACRITVMLLALVLATASAGLTAEKIVVDGSTGVMPLVAALAKAYREQHPAATVEIGQGLGTKARVQALAEGKIDIALVSHGLRGRGDRPAGHGRPRDRVVAASAATSRCSVSAMAGRRPTGRSPAPSP